MKSSVFFRMATSGNKTHTNPMKFQWGRLGSLVSHCPWKEEESQRNSTLTSDGCDEMVKENKQRMISKVEGVDIENDAFNSQPI